MGIKSCQKLIERVLDKGCTLYLPCLLRDKSAFDCGYKVIIPKGCNSTRDNDYMDV